MKLSQMQDLGGCRAIMPTVEYVDTLVRIHQDAWDKAPSRHELHRIKKASRGYQRNLSGRP
jgi:hypothetical protein